MVLSERLREVSMLVTPGNRVADIGTDHGYVPVFLVKEGRIPSAIAMDVNPGPLLRAREHIRQHALEDRIQTRLSDGLAKLREGEADTVLIAGMGGALCIRILQEGKNILGQIRELVLQPQSEIASVRRYLAENGWKITQERMVLEDGKYYQMMRCAPGRMELTRAQAEYGPCLMKDRPVVFDGYLLWRKKILEKNLSQLEKTQTERGRTRREEICRQLEMLEDVSVKEGHRR